MELIRVLALAMLALLIIAAGLFVISAIIAGLVEGIRGKGKGGKE